MRGGLNPLRLTRNPLPLPRIPLTLNTATTRTSSAWRRFPSNTRKTSRTPNPTLLDHDPLPLPPNPPHPAEGSKSTDRTPSAEGTSR